MDGGNFGSERLADDVLRELVPNTMDESQLAAWQIVMHQPEYYHTLRLLFGESVARFKMTMGGTKFEPERDVTKVLEMKRRTAASVGNNPNIPVEDHLPLIDFDGDRFSTIQTLRGTDWRGKDCDDFNKDVYPGRLVDTVGPMKDHNCNGILGVDKSTGKSYEQLF